MSLILEALKKLDREKQSPERGFLVVAAASWPAKTRKPLLALAAGVVIIAGVGAAVVAARRPRGAVAPSSAPRPASAAPAAVTDESPAASPAPIAPLFLPVPAPAQAAPPRPTPAPPAAPATAVAAAPAATVVAAPAAAPSAAPPPLVLQAISSKDGRPIALVNDRLVREGDAFDGVTIIRIGDAEVEVEWKGQRSILRF